MSKKTKVLIIVLILLILIGGVTGFIIYKNKKEQERIEKERAQKLKDVESHFALTVKTNKETKLYDCNSNKEVGSLGIGVETTLKETKLTYETKYFTINEFENEYCINYKDVEPIKELTEKDDRYKLYIPFNENVVTKEKTNFYNKENNLVYSFDKSFDFPIIIKDNDKYYVEFNNQLLYVKKDEIKETKYSNNSNEKKASSISVLCYHAFYDPKTEVCNNVICHSEKQFNDHLTYLNNNKFMTLKMDEFEMFIDGKLNIPKNSVLITIDDGYMGERAIPILEDHKAYATMFLITAWYSKKDFESDYLELHSHSHNLHNQYECPGYGTQGGGILCKSKEYIVNDLKKSSELLDGSKAFCYPFYDYNEHSIEALKEAGYTLAFQGGRRKAKIGENKYKIPRYTILSYDTVESFAAIVRQY